MSMKLPKWCAVFLMTLALSGCYIKQHVIPMFLPKSEHEIFLKRVDYLESQGINVVVAGDTLRIVIPADDFFEADSAEFDRHREPVLRTIAHILNTRGCAPIYVTGHTDDIGTSDHKQKRSYDWAFAISSYLWNNGVHRDRMHIEGHADDHDVATYSSVAGSSYNRRIEIFMDTPA